MSSLWPDSSYTSATSEANSDAGPVASSCAFCLSVCSVIFFLIARHVFGAKRAAISRPLRCGGGLQVLGGGLRPSVQLGVWTENITHTDQSPLRQRLQLGPSPSPGQLGSQKTPAGQPRVN